MIKSSSLLSSSVVLCKPYFKFRTPLQASRVRAQSYKEEGAGRSSQMVDANLSVLRERIEKVKAREKLERCCRREHGWNYAAGYDYKLERNTQMLKLLQLVRVVFATLGFTFFSCTAFLCFVSALVHMNQ